MSALTKNEGCMTRTVPRSKIWWNTVISGEVYSGWWKDNLRMSRPTFELLCDKLCPHIQKQVYQTVPKNNNITVVFLLVLKKNRIHKCEKVYL